MPMLKLILAILLVMAIYSLYKYFAGRSESRADQQSSNGGQVFDERRAVEAEYRIVEEEEQEEDG